MHRSGEAVEGIRDAHLLAVRRISVLAYDRLVIRKVPGQPGQLIHDFEGFFGHCVMGMILQVEDVLPYICFLRVGSSCDCDDDYDGAACVSGVLCELFSHLEQCIHSYNV